MENNTEKQEYGIAQIYTIEKLLKENGELKEQLQKAEQDKKSMGELLKSTIEFINSLNTWEVLKYSKEKQLANTLYDKATECLTNCGITA